MKLPLFVLLASGLMHYSPAYAFQNFYGTSADGWKTQNSVTYKSTPQPSSQNSLATSSCIQAIIEEEHRSDMPENLLLAIGLQEAGLKRDGQLTVWPWTINHAGKGYRFDSKTEAVDFAESLIGSGVKSFDVGCMQINLRWHKSAFSTLSEAFDPQVNVAYAAEYLLSLKAETTTWMQAASMYHSRTVEHRNRYHNSLLQNLKVAAANRLSFTQKLGTANFSSGYGQSDRHEVSTEKSSFYNRNTLSKRVRVLQQQNEINDLQRARRAKEPNIQANSAPKKGSWWDAELSTSHSKSEKRTIYSTEEIQPILPDLIFIR